MKREYPDTPLIGVGAIIVEDDRIVLVKRGHAPLLGEWSVPGGLLEVGETVRAAAVREALEETGLTVEARELLGVFDRVIRDDDGKVLYHYVLIDFFCRRVSGQLQAAGDAADARWVTQEQIEHMALPRETAEVIHLGFATSPK